VDTARNQVASLIGAKAQEIIFTSGATEAINLAITGTLNASAKERKHIITWATEHKAVLDVFAHHAERGTECTILPVDRNGLPDLNQLQRCIRPETILVSMMAANNETGVIMPVREAATIAHGHGALFFTDATQAVGKIPFSVTDGGVDLAAFSAHKVYGPKGVGGLYIRNGISKPEPLFYGGGHERNLRSGTLNVPGIAGMGKAFAIAAARMTADAERLSHLRNQLADTVCTIPGVRWNSKHAELLPHVASITFGFPNGERMLDLIAREVAASSGSACSSAITRPSHVLEAMGLDEHSALSTIRFSLGRDTTEKNIVRATEAILSAAGRLRG